MNVNLMPTRKVVAAFNDRNVVEFVLTDKLTELRNVLKKLKRIRTATSHTANRSYRQTSQEYCAVIETYYRFNPTARQLP